MKTKYMSCSYGFKSILLNLPKSFQMIKIIALFKTKLLAPLYMVIGIVPTCRKHLHDSIIWLRGEVWTHMTYLTPPLFIEVPVARPESVWSCIGVLEWSILPLFTILLFDFVTVPTVLNVFSVFFLLHFIISKYLYEQ